MGRKVIDDEFISRMETLALEIKTQMSGYFGGNHKAQTYGSTVEFADFREYTPGDDIRRVDWNLFGRFDRYFIRRFVDERQMHNQILLDCSASMEGNGEKGQYALQTAAALGYLSVQGMDRTSMRLIQGDSLVPVGTTISGKESFYHVVKELEKVRFEGEADLLTAVQNSQETGYDDGLTMLISDFFTESDWKQTVDYLLYKKREVMLVQVLTPEEQNPAYSGRIHLLDAEAVTMEDERNMKLRITKHAYKAYRQALADYLADMRQFCRSRNVAYVTVTTANPIEQELLNRLYETEAVR
ncbi:MAG: DUF58 domain-containing protein [Lachnospiraceae bacterium]|nr:DUF58 domain-containing protein [Lachnospiraceae bacterium]